MQGTMCCAGGAINPNGPTRASNYNVGSYSPTLYDFRGCTFCGESTSGDLKDVGSTEAKQLASVKIICRD